MTSGLDIVTNDAGELVRAAHARDSGEEVLIALHRLASMVRMHDTDNQAFLRQLEQTHKAVLYYCLHAGRDLVVLFADRVVLIGGQLLRGSRTAYEAATELGERFMWCGGAELTIQRDVQQKDLRAFAETLAIAMRSKRSEEFKSPTPKIRLRGVSEAVRVRGLNIERMNYEQKLVRTYASAVVVMRRFFEAMRSGRYVLPKRLKRIAQGLVDLSEGRATSFLGVTEVRNANHDDAGRAVNTAIIAVAAARQITSDRPTLSQLAMAALLFDAGRPRAESRLPKGIIAAKLSDGDEDCMPAGAAVVLTALGRMNEPTIARTVLTFESLWLRRAKGLGPVYGGKLEPTVQSRLIAISRRYNDLLTPEPGLPPPTPDYAIGSLAQECTDKLDLSVLRMIVAALGLVPAGTKVKLSTGETAEIIATEERAAGERPRVLLLADSRGKPIKPPRLLDLAESAKGKSGPEIASVLSTEGWKSAGAQLQASMAASKTDYDADEEPAQEPQLQDSQPQKAQLPASEPAPSYEDDSELAFEPEGEPEAELEAVEEQDEPESMQSGVGGPPSASLSFSLGWNGPPPPSAAVQMRSPVSVPPRQAPQYVPPQPSAPPPEPEDAEEHTVYESSPFGAEQEAEADDGESTQYFPGGIKQADSLDEMVPPVEPSATGNLKGTPLPNVLVYMLDRALTGTLLLRPPDGKAHALYFDGGAPAKLRMGHPIAPLSEELLAARLTVPQAIDACMKAAQQQRIPLADFLRLQRLVPEDGLANALRQQLLHRIEWLVKLPEETSYAFYQDYNALEHWGGEGVGEYEPLDVILAANRVWKNHARIISTLTKLGENPIVLHPDADLTGLSLTHDEQSLLDMIRTRPGTMAELYNQYSVSDKVVSTMLYTLLITRQLMLPGQARPPMKPRRSAVRQTMPARPQPSGQQVQAAPVATAAAMPPRVSPVPPEPLPASARRATVPDRPPQAVASPISSRSPNPPQAVAPSRASFAGTDPDSARRALGLAPASSARATTPQRAVVLPDPAEVASHPPVSISDVRATTAEAPEELESEDDSRQSYPSFASFQNFGAGPSSVGPSPVSLAATPPSSSGTPVSADGSPKSKLTGKPAAKGDLVVTPMVHILVYMLDHAATGTVQMIEPDGTEHLIAFRDGVPNRMKTGRPVELLGQLLVEAGLLAPGAVDNALQEAKQIDAPLGEYLVLHEIIKRQQLDVVLQVQLLRKFAALANLPPETTYAFYRDVNALEDWGGKSPIRVDPLQVLLETVRAWYDRHRIRGTLFRMKDRTLVLCIDGNTAALREDPSAKAVIDAIEAGGMNILNLYRKRVADEEDVNSVVYTLAVTRHFTFASQKGPPMGTGPRTG